MADPRIIQQLHEDVVEHLLAIERLFLDPVKVSVIVRNPAHPSGTRDVYVSSDTPDEAIAAIRQVVATGEETKARGG